MYIYALYSTLLLVILTFKLKDFTWETVYIFLLFVKNMFVIWIAVSQTDIYKKKMKVSWFFSWNLGNKTVFLENKTTRRCRRRRAGNGCHRHSNRQKDPYITGNFQLQNVNLISLIQGVWVIHDFFEYLINKKYFSSICNFLFFWILAW